MSKNTSATNIILFIGCVLMIFGFVSLCDSSFFSAILLIFENRDNLDSLGFSNSDGLIDSSNFVLATKYSIIALILNCIGFKKAAKPRIFFEKLILMLSFVTPFLICCGWGLLLLAG